MFVITSLPSEISADQILSCYRLRWQVELVFKRLKSLLGLGSIPTKTKEAGETWINGKALLSLLTEKYLGDIDFSPSWNLRRESEYVQVKMRNISHFNPPEAQPSFRFFHNIRSYNRNKLPNFYIVTIFFIYILSNSANIGGRISSIFPN